MSAITEVCLMQDYVAYISEYDAKTKRMQLYEIVESKKRV